MADVVVRLEAAEVVVEGGPNVVKVSADVYAYPTEL